MTAAVPDPVDPQLIEQIAIALYEDSRDPDYYEAEYDWPNIDTGYDKDDEDETDPEWLRNRFRHQARVAFAVVDPLLRQAREALTKATDEHQALAVIGELTVADRPYDWRITEIVRVLDSVRARASAIGNQP